MYGQRGPQKGQNLGSQRPPLMELPPNLKLMFEPLAPLEFKPPVENPNLPPYSGVSQYVSLFETNSPPKPKPFETPAEKKEKAKERLQKLNKEKNDLLAHDWDPHNNSKATENAYLTLFVGRLSYDTTEKKLRREFESYGPIRKIRVVTDSDGKSRGYAFIEFENESDMTNAYRKSNGKKIDGKRVVCDVERGRTVRNWRPMRFGGGLGCRIAQNSKKEQQPQQEVVVEVQPTQSNSNYDSRDRSREESRRPERERSRSRDRRERDRSGNRSYYRENGNRSDHYQDRDRDRGGYSRNAVPYDSHVDGGRNRGSDVYQSREYSDRDRRSGRSRDRR